MWNPSFYDIHYVLTHVVAQDPIPYSTGLLTPY